MNPLDEAVLEVCQFLEQHRVRYGLMGGYALQRWGEPRATRDIDIEIVIEESEKATVFEHLLSRFQPRIQNALEFAMRHRVLLLYASNGIPVDISLAPPGYGELVAQRLQKIQVMPDYPPVFVISAEDLVIHKCIANRPVDRQDIQSILIRQGARLDIEYIRDCLSAFAPYVEEFDLLEVFESCLQAVELQGADGASSEGTSRGK